MPRKVEASSEGNSSEAIAAEYGRATELFKLALNNNSLQFFYDNERIQREMKTRLEVLNTPPDILTKNNVSRASFNKYDMVLNKLRNGGYALKMLPTITDSTGFGNFGLYGPHFHLLDANRKFLPLDTLPRHLYEGPNSEGETIKMMNIRKENIDLANTEKNLAVFNARWFDDTHQNELIVRTDFSDTEHNRERGLELHVWGVLPPFTANGKSWQLYGTKPTQDLKYYSALHRPREE